MANGTIYYNSLYRHGIDDKRRLQIPSKWRTAESGAEFTLILWPKGSQSDACLLVLPPVEMAALAQKLKAMPFADPRAETLRRLVGTKSDQVAVDKAGRIVLPEGMVRSAGLEKEAILVGLVDRFEIWSPERYETTQREDELLSHEAFKLL